MTALTDYFTRAVKRHRSQMRIASVVMLVVGTIGAVWGLSEDHPDRAMARMAAMSMIGLVVFTGMLIATFFPHRGLAALREPGRIVWFYAVSRQGYVQRLMIGLEDGKLRSLPVPHHSQASEGIELLRAAAPGAAEGFSEERRVAFKRDPRSLRAARA